MARGWPVRPSIRSIRSAAISHCCRVSFSPSRFRTWTWKNGCWHFVALGHDLHVAEGVLDIGRFEAAKLPQARRVPRPCWSPYSAASFTPLLWVVPLEIMAGPCAPRSPGCAAAAARVSASAAKHSCAVSGPPAFRTWAIWLRLLPTLFNAAVARPSASALTGGLRWRAGRVCRGRRRGESWRGSGRLRARFPSTAALFVVAERTGTASGRAGVSGCRSAWRRGCAVVVRRHGRTPHERRTQQRRRPEGAETGRFPCAAWRQQGGDATGRAKPPPCQVERRHAAESRWPERGAVYPRTTCCRSYLARIILKMNRRIQSRAQIHFCIPHAE